MRGLAAGRLPVLLIVALLSVAGCDAVTTPTPAATTATTASANPSAPEGSVAATGASPEPSASAASSSTLVAPTVAPSPSFATYLVAPNDTLTSIARRFKTTARSIAYWNRTTYPSLDPQSPSYAPNRIEIGWSLVLLPGAVVSEDEPLPGASPTPRPSLVIPPGPSPLPSGSSLLVSHGTRGSNVVALTFDMGGRVDPAVDIVTWLIDHDIPATIFPTGTIASTTPEGRQVIALVGAHPDLFSVGNHTWNHPDLTKLDPAAIEDELTRTETTIAGTTGRSTRPFFRPPFGDQNQAVRDAAGSAGWSYTVMWDVDTIDWKPTSDGGPTAADIAAKVLSRAQGGSIVLMHLGGYHTLEALPEIVDGLRQRGLEPVTLGTMFGL